MRVAASKAGSWVEGRGFRKVIGGKRFDLGKDEQRAVVASLQLEAVWLSVSQIWTPEALQTAEGIRLGLNGQNAPECKPAKLVAVQKPTALTVKEAVERYSVAMMESQRLSSATRYALHWRSKALKQSPIATLPLSAVGPEEITRAVNYYLSRPMVKGGKQLSSHSAKMQVGCLRQCFDWLDLNGLWIAPRRFERLFRLPRSNYEPPKVETFTIDELKALYQRANERQRLYILLGLNCGFCSMEVATLKAREVDLDAKVIRRHRQKTGVIAQWNLWDETAELLKKYMTHEGEFTLTNENGLPLVRYVGSKRKDNLKDTWRRLCGRAEIRKPFKLLRKTGATMVRSIGGIEVSEMYLAHSEKSMAKHYSKPDPQRLTDTLATLRAQLQPMFAK